MKENERADVPDGTLDARVIALGDVSLPDKEITMTHTRFAFVKANWHGDIVGEALKGFLEIIPSQQVDEFDVPGAFELPLVARDLATSAKYAAVVAAALVVDGGISVALTPHHYQETEHHRGIYLSHFVEKGKEAARAALEIIQTRARIAA
jgi:6,7-dimethyl-8-ribityllumazine synthase